MRSVAELIRVRNSFSSASNASKFQSSGYPSISANTEINLILVVFIFGRSRELNVECCHRNLKFRNFEESVSWQNTRQRKTAHQTEYILYHHIEHGRCNHPGTSASATVERAVGEDVARSTLSSGQRTRLLCGVA